MLAQNSYEYIKIGLAIRLLRNVSKSNAAKFVIDVISDLKSQLEKADFAVSTASTKSSTFLEMEQELNLLGANNEIGETLRINISGHSATLENVVFAEAITKKIYILPNRRFNTDILLNHPERLLKEGTFEKLDDIAQADIASACRCILFGEATASAFHILRATESALKSYYFHHRKQNRLEKPMWGNMLDQLKAKTKNKPSATLLSSLDNIRTGFRNPTQHPQAIYQIDSAQDLFGVCLDVIGKMGEEL